MASTPLSVLPGADETGAGVVAVDDEEPDEVPSGL